MARAINGRHDPGILLLVDLFQFILVKYRVQREVLLELGAVILALVIDIVVGSGVHHESGRNVNLFLLVKADRLEPRLADIDSEVGLHLLVILGRSEIQLVGKGLECALVGSGDTPPLVVYGQFKLAVGLRRNQDIHIHAVKTHTERREAPLLIGRDEKQHILCARLKLAHAQHT